MRLAKRVIACAATIFACTACAHADDAMELAKRLTSEGAKTFASKNLTAMMSTWADDSRVEIISRNQSTGGLNRDVHTGKAEIRTAYENMFKTEGSIEARNVVETARFIGSNLLLITGTFEVTAGGRNSSFAFVQTRTKDGDKWLLTSVQIYVASQ